MQSKTKTIRTIYFYTVALISLIFLAVGAGNFINTSLKAYVFTGAEKRDYTMCNSQPYFSTVEAEKIGASNAVTQDQKTQIDNMISDYQNWKQNNTGDECYRTERQKRMVDSLTMILIALPIYLIHWMAIKKEKQTKDEE